jgi:hypothetical protein
VTSSDIFYSLDRILETPAFTSSPQLTSFLTYVVREELAGRGDLIKAYTVAVDGLGRPESFDAGKSPLIRVVATRLRRAIDAAYDEEAIKVPVRIRLNKGSYRPRFEPFDQAVAEPLEPPPPPARATPPPEHPTQRYVIVIVVLLALLALSALYIGWDVFRQINAA